MPQGACRLVCMVEGAAVSVTSCQQGPSTADPPGFGPSQCDQQYRGHELWRQHPTSSLNLQLQRTHGIQ